MSDDLTAFVGQMYCLPDCQVQKFGSGLINETYVVASDKDAYIMQQMHDMFPPQIMHDFVAVTEHLAAAGWSVPRVVRTVDDELWHTESPNEWWRMMTFIASDLARPAVLSVAAYTAIGELLARWHGDMKALTYQPVYVIPHFHETSHYAQRLQAVLPVLASTGMLPLAESILQAFAKLPSLKDAVPQLIHGDPQTSNILFSDGQPFTFIDFDTIMRGSIWLDVGDLLRSLAEDVVEQGGGLPLRDIQAVIGGYYAAASSKLSQDEFVNSALVALQQIALELAMRFLIDVIEDAYFSYDIDKFSSRRASNSHRAQVQWKLYTLCQEVIND